jgi:Secretion system C-terminal sorting domain
MKKKLLTIRQTSLLVTMLFPYSLVTAQSSSLFQQPNGETAALAFNSNSNAFALNSSMGFTQGSTTYNYLNPFVSEPSGNVQDEDGHYHENENIAHNLLSPSAACYPGTINRFTGSYHSNLYIGNTLGANVLLSWGQLMLDYTTGTTTSTNITSPTVVAAASYGGVPLEVRSASSGGAAGLSSFALRTSTKLYVFGTSANITAITSYAGFGGAALTTAASDVTAKLPAGVLVTDIAQMAMSQTAFAIVTTAGEVWVLTKVLNMQGDNAAAATPLVWHHVVLSGGVTGVGPYLTGVTKISISGSGILAATGTNKLYYWGAAANVTGVVAATTYKFAFDMSAQIPAGKIVKDVVVLGTKAPTVSTLFILCDDTKVYATGLNTNGCLGINNATVTFNQPTFITVKGTDGLTDLANIVKIDGDTEADIYCMGAESVTGQIYGWGDSPAGMLGLNGATGSFPVPKTVQLYIPAPNLNFTDFSIAGHFTIAFYSSGGTDQYWYLGHNTGGSVGDPLNVTAFILAAAPAPLNSSGGITFDCSAAVLPLTWLSFTAQKNETSVLLNWSTASEQNTKNFLVQYSIDGITWKTISTVLSAVNSSTIENYSFVHTNPANGISYYRLLQQDMDGRNSYSKTIKILFHNINAKQLIVYPTSVTDGNINLQLQQATAINLYNSIGELVLSKQMSAGTHTLNVSNFAKGMYMLQAGTETEKFIIQ